MGNEVLVSIIIPTCKGSSTVELSVVSAICQNNIKKEIIVVDDNGIGTNDQVETENVLMKYIKDARIKYVCHKYNKNGSAARNTGLKLASGKYITFIDDDDCIFENKLFKQVEQLEHLGNKYGISISSGYYVNNNGIGYYKKLKSNTDFMNNYLLDHYYFNTSAILFRTSVIKKIGGFDESFIRHQDWETCIRILTITKPCVINEPLFVRYFERRNIPNKIQIRINNLNYFFKMSLPYMRQELSENEIKKIIIYKNRNITLSMIINKRFKNAYKFSKSYGGKIEFFISMFCIPFVFLRKLFCGLHKVVESRKEMEIKYNL